jgi:hypothetical protein
VSECGTSKVQFEYTPAPALKSSRFSTEIESRACARLGRVSEDIAMRATTPTGLSPSPAIESSRFSTEKRAALSRGPGRLKGKHEWRNPSRPEYTMGRACPSIANTADRPPLSACSNKGAARTRGSGRSNGYGEGTTVPIGLSPGPPPCQQLSRQRSRACARLSAFFGSKAAALRPNSTGHQPIIPLDRNAVQPPRRKKSRAFARL